MPLRNSLPKLKGDRPDVLHLQRDRVDQPSYGADVLLIVSASIPVRMDRLAELVRVFPEFAQP